MDAEHGKTHTPRDSSGFQGRKSEAWLSAEVLKGSVLNDSGLKDRTCRGAVRWNRFEVGVQDR